MNKNITIRNDMSVTDIGSVFAQSGFFSDAREASKAVVKILAGQEIGFSPVASMTGIHIIKGQVSIGGNLMAAAIKRHPNYNYRITQHTDTVCEITFFEGGEECGRSVFSMDDAKKANLNKGVNWTNYPRNMLFNRAISNGARWYCPDIFGGNPVYTPDELGIDTNGETGEIIDGTITNPEPQPEEPATNGNSERPYTPEALKRRLHETEAKHLGEDASNEQRNLVVGMLDMIFEGDDDKRRTVQNYLFGDPSFSSAGHEQALAALDWLKPQKDSGGAYTPDPLASTEARAVYAAQIKDEGQQELI